MAAESALIVETGAAAALFAVVFLLGNHVHPLRSLVHDRRSIISFSAGMSTAYVFVHLMPELHGARRAFAESVSAPLPYEGIGVYLLALLGFLAFYGLDHLRARLRESAHGEEHGAAFRLHIGGFAAYVGLTAYLLVHNLEETKVSIGLYAVAFGFHFLAVEHALREEHGAAYERIGRWVLASMCVLGWAVGLVVELPHYTIALLVAFVSGAVIINSSVMELPTEKDGRFVPFVIGGLLYGVILLPLA